MAAGCLIRSAIEVMLRQLCERHDCTPRIRKGPPGARPRISRCVRSLWRRGVLDGHLGHRTKRALEKLNGPAHGRPMTADSAARWAIVARALLALAEPGAQLDATPEPTREAQQQPTFPLRIVNDVTGAVYTANVPGTRTEVIGKLALQQRGQGRRRRWPASDLSPLRFCVHVAGDVVTLHWYAKPGADDLAAGIMEVFAAKAAIDAGGPAT